MHNQPKKKIFHRLTIPSVPLVGICNHQT